MTDDLINSIEINKNKKGFTVLDVPSNKFVNALASFFKEKNVIKLPE
jgi:glutathione peroxidase-family protein